MFGKSILINAIMASLAVAQIDYSIVVSKAGSDCDLSESWSYVQYDGSENIAVYNTPICVSVGQPEYDVQFDWDNNSGQKSVPPVYACPDSSCDGGCIQLYATGSRYNDFISSCEHVYNGAYLKVDGVE